VKNFTNYFGIGTDAQVAYIAQKLKAKTAALKRVAYGFAGFLSFWIFCGGLKKKITHIL
jgi:diacylglycerol kinase family enzyme